MDRDNDGKVSRVAVVPGASAGIGAVVARTLAAQSDDGAYKLWEISEKLVAATGA